MKLIIAVSALLCLVTLLEGKAITKRHEIADLHELCKDDCDSAPLEVSFVIDASASIWRSNFTKGMWFVKNFVNRFNIGPNAVRVSVVTFGNRVYTEDAFNFADHTTKESLDAAIEAMPYPSGTSTQTGMGINYMLNEQMPHARPGVRKVIIVLTDGNSQQPKVTKAAADRALDEGLEVFAIGVGHEVSEEELHNIASDDEHVFVVDSYHMLDEIIDRLHFETCGKALPQPEPFKTCESSPADVAFVIDSSQSVGQGNFTLGLEFINDFLQPFEIPITLRVAAVMFGERVYDESAMNFDDDKNKRDTLDEILGLSWRHGSRTETGAGIDYMIKHFLPETRPFAAHVCIVITDGMSQRWKYTEEAAARARDAGVVMFAVGIGKVGPGGNLDETELRNIAGDPSRVVLAEDYAMLNDIRKKLQDITCSGIAWSLESKPQ